MLWKVSCSPGDYEEENIIEYIRVPESLVGKGEFFALIAKGHFGVDGGDRVIVRNRTPQELALSWSPSTTVV